MRKSGLLAVALLLVFSAIASAIPAQRTVNYQGRLTDSSGNPVADGNYVITFRLYDDSNALIGAAKWTESLTNVKVENGYFNVRLGSTNPLLSKTIDFNTQYWLGVQVGSDNEMTPRQPLNGVPFVLNYDVPVGSIIAWHKNMAPGAPALSSQWVECNGQTISDSESVFDGQTIPDLNSTGRFLRGSNHSGDIQNDAMQGHHHQIYGSGTTGGAALGIMFSSALSTIGPQTNDARAPVTDGSNGAPRYDSETRPKNMSMVWIMKIK